MAWRHKLPKLRPCGAASLFSLYLLCSCAVPIAANKKIWTTKPNKLWHMNGKSWLNGGVGTKLAAWVMAKEWQTLHDVKWMIKTNWRRRGHKNRLNERLWAIILEKKSTCALRKCQSISMRLSTNAQLFPGEWWSFFQVKCNNTWRFILVSISGDTDHSKIRCLIPFLPCLPSP